MPERFHSPAKKESADTVLQREARNTFELILKANRLVPNTYSAIRVCGAFGVVQAAQANIDYMSLSKQLTAQKKEFGIELKAARDIGHTAAARQNTRTAEQDTQVVENTINDHLTKGIEFAIHLYESIPGKINESITDTNSFILEFLAGLMTILQSPEMDSARNEYWEGLIEAFNDDMGFPPETIRDGLGANLSEEWIEQYKASEYFKVISSKLKKGVDISNELKLATSQFPSI